VYLHLSGRSARDEHSSFRQKIKKVMQQILLAKYVDLLSPPEFEGGNQQELYDLVQGAVHKSLKEGLFLRGGEDENVSFFLFKYFFLTFLATFEGQMQKPCTSSNTYYYS
jgi:hypothetical protein